MILEIMFKIIFFKNSIIRIKLSYSTARLTSYVIVKHILMQFRKFTFKGFSKKMIPICNVIKRFHIF